jgi:excisionase family DNA binding protein
MAATAHAPQSLSVKGFAAEWGVSLRTAYQLVRDGKVPSVRVGGQIRIPRAALVEWLEVNTRGGRKAA